MSFKIRLRLKVRENFMQTINNIMLELLGEGLRPVDIAESLGISKAMISIWKNKSNDFVPRLPLAKRLYQEYGKIAYPYAEEALSR